MEKSKDERYATLLERTVRNNHHFLKEAVKEFRERSLLVTPDRNVPQGIIVDLREAYKEIQNRIKEIKAIEQLLHGRYRAYSRRDPLRDKEIMELGFLAKGCNSKVESTLLAFKKRSKLREEEQTRAPVRKALLSSWFRGREHQVALLKSVRLLSELDYEAGPEAVPSEQRRQTGQVRSFTFFLFEGEASLLDELQSRIRFREHDVVERSSRREIRGVLTHLRDVDFLDVTGIFKRVLASPGGAGLRCLLIPVQSTKDLAHNLDERIAAAMAEMRPGEVTTLPI
jgi:hypothetical protein